MKKIEPITQEDVDKIDKNIPTEDASLVHLTIIIDKIINLLINQSNDQTEAINQLIDEADKRKEPKEDLSCRISHKEKCFTLCSCGDNSTYDPCHGACPCHPWGCDDYWYKKSLEKNK